MSMVDQKLHDDMQKAECQRVKCAIHLHLANRNQWWYLSQIRPIYHRTPETFNAALKECIEEGSIVEITGERGSTILARAIGGVPLNPTLIKDVAPKS